MHARTALAFAAIVAVPSAFAGVAPTTPDWTMTISGNDGVQHAVGANVQNPSGVTNGFEVTPGAKEGQFSIAANSTWMVADLFMIEVSAFSFDTDPFISYSFNITNVSGTTQTFDLSTSIGTSGSHAGPSLIRGSTSGSINDNNLDGVTISTVAGSSLYSALVDGSAVRTLHDDPFSVFFPVGGTNIPTATTVDHGLGAYENIATGWNSSIGIRNHFTLTAGDTAQMVSTFEIIPTPGATALLAVAGVAAVRRRRG